MTDMQGKANNKSQPMSVSTLVRYSYSYMALFTISVEFIGLVTTYLLGIMFHYDILMRTHCAVSRYSFS